MISLAGFLQHWRVNALYEIKLFLSILGVPFGLVNGKLHTQPLALILKQQWETLPDDLNCLLVLQ